MKLALEFVMVLTLMPMQVGQPTVGPKGTFRQTSGEGIEVAIRESLDEYGYAFIGPGVHRMNGPLTLTSDDDGCAIYGAPGSVLLASDEAVGALHITADNVLLNGFTIRASTYVADQKVVHVEDSQNQIFQSMKFELTDSSGSATSMKMIYLDHAMNTKFIGSTFHPNKGLTVIHGENSYNPLSALASGSVLNGNGLHVIGCEFGTPTPAANPDGFSGYQQAYRIIYLDGYEYTNVTGSRFFQLGTLTNPLDSIIAIRAHSSALVESGHVKVSGCSFERVSCPKSIQILGTGSVLFTGNLCGLAGQVGGTTPVPDEAGEAFLVITGRDGTATGTLQPGQIDIISNSFHNLAQADTNGAFIYADFANNLNIVANSFDVCTSNNVIRLNPGGSSGSGAKLRSVRIAYNTAHAYASDVDCFINIAADAGGYFDRGFVASGNIIGETFTAAILDPQNVLGTSASGRRVIFTGIQDITTGNDPDSGSAPNELTTNVRLGL